MKQLICDQCFYTKWYNLIIYLYLETIRHTYLNKKISINGESYLNVLAS